MKIIYTGSILKFSENKDIKICIDYLDEHYTIRYNDIFLVKQYMTSDQIKYLTIRYYKITKYKPKVGITTYMEFQQFDLKDFYHINDVLIKAETYIVKDLVREYTEEINDMQISLAIHFNFEIDETITLQVDNCKSKILKQKHYDKTMVYTIKIIDIMKDFDKIAYVITNRELKYRIESKYIKNEIKGVFANKT